MTVFVFHSQPIKIVLISNRLCVNRIDVSNLEISTTKKKMDLDILRSFDVFNSVIDNLQVSMSTSLNRNFHFLKTPKRAQGVPKRESNKAMGQLLLFQRVQSLRVCNVITKSSVRGQVAISSYSRNDPAPVTASSLNQRRFNRLSCNFESSSLKVQILPLR